VVNGPFNYTPSPSQSCWEANVSLPVGFGATLGIPLVYCSPEIEVFPNNNTWPADRNAHSMGTRWTGQTSGQRQIDFAFDFVASSTTTTPIYSDYIWMGVRSCGLNPWNGCYGTHGPYLTEEFRWTDGGWDK
jgi:hypothetical protein